MKSLTLKLLKRSGSGAASFKAILSILFAVVLLLVSSCSDPSNPANTGTGDNTSQAGDNPSGDNPSTDNPSTDNPSGGTDNPSGDIDNPSSDNRKIIEITVSELAAAIQNYTAETNAIYKVSGEMTDDDYDYYIRLISQKNQSLNWKQYMGLDLSNVTGLTKVKWLGCLYSLTIPNTVTNLGFDRLNNLSILDDNPNFVWDDGVLYSKDKTVLYLYSKDKTGDSFVIPSGVKSIYHFAFENAKAKTVTIPASVIDIGERAFWQTLIFENTENWISDVTGKVLTAEELANPDNFTYYNDETFVNGPCRNGIYKPVTKTVAIENLENEIKSYNALEHTIFKVTGSVSNEVYRQIASLIKYKAETENWRWDPHGYIGLDLTEVTDLTSVDWTRDGMFSLAIPESVTKIGSAVDIIVNLNDNPNFLCEDGVLYSKDKKILYSYSRDKKDETFKIPSGVETIWENAFENNSYIKNIKIPASVLCIFSNAFNNAFIQTLEFADKEGWMGLSANDKVIKADAQDLENVDNYRWDPQTREDGIFQNILIKVVTKEITVDDLEDEIEAYEPGAFTSYKVTGKMMNDLLTQIEELVNQKYEEWGDCYVGLDLSAVTGLTNIRNYAFFELVIPEDFVPNEFSSFEGVTIPAANKNFVYDEDGVLYSADKTILCRFAQDYEEDAFVIPSMVQKICADAFERIYTIDSLTIPQSVTYIGAHAFENSSIQTISFENKDGWMAKVSYNNLIEVSARDLENIANYKWDSQTQQNGICRNGLFKFEIKTVTAGQLKSEIETKTSASYTIYTVSGEMTNNQFREISQLVEEKRDDEWNGQVCIGLDLSAVTGLTRVSLSNFFKLVIPEDFIPDEECSLADLLIPEGNTNFVYEDGVLYSTDKTILYRFDESGEKESFIIPSTVTKIWRDAFWDIRNIKSITIPQGVTYIGAAAFANHWIETLTFADKENWIPARGGRSLYAQELENVDYYGYYERNPASGRYIEGLIKPEIKTITIAQLADELDNYQAGKYTVYKLSGQMSNSEYDQVQNLINNKKNTVWNNEKYVGLDLSGVTGLTKIDCTWGLMSLTIPSSVVDFGDSAQFREIKISDDNTNFIYEDGIIYSKAKTSLYYYLETNPAASFEIPSGVKKIWSAAFCWNEYIKNITIPESVEFIGMAAFETDSLETLTFKDKQNWFASDGDVPVSPEDLEDPANYGWIDDLGGNGICRNGIYKSE